MFQKAKREKVKVKIALIGPSGSGKTYSALKLATGIGGKIALLDTEAGRSKYYATEFDFDIAELDAPFSPERYIEIIEQAEKAGYDTLIIDSITHEWNGTGGCLDIHNNMPGNSYANWSKVTPRHNKFIEKIIHCNMNIISTVRGKDQYVLEEDDRGKNVPKKVGMGGVQRDGIEYEYTCTFMIDVQTHVATPQKDNTHLFEDRYEVLSEKHGELLKEWADSGIKPVKKVNEQTIAAIMSFVKKDKNSAVIVRDDLKNNGYGDWKDLKNYTQEEAEALIEKIKAAINRPKEQTEKEQYIQSLMLNPSEDWETVKLFIKEAGKELKKKISSVDDLPEDKFEEICSLFEHVKSETEAKKAADDYMNGIEVPF